MNAVRGMQIAIAASVAASTFACANPTGGGEAVALLQLADHLDTAEVTSAAAPAAARAQRQWTFDQPSLDWRPYGSPAEPTLAGITLAPLPDGVRLALEPPLQPQSPLRIGGLARDLEGSVLGDWETALIRARSRHRFAGISVTYNVDQASAAPDFMAFFLGADSAPPLFNDGSEQTYAIPLRPRAGDTDATPLRSLAVVAAAPGPAALDLLALTLVPRGASYLEDAGVRPVVRDGETRRTLFAHTPATLRWRPTLPVAARLDLGLTASAGEAVSYRVEAGPPGGEAEVLLEERVEDAGRWQQRSLDLSRWAGRSVELSLSATSERQGAVALWGAPLLSGEAGAQRPNVVFYVIDGGGADLMSLYGYGRRTTPFLEELAAQGTVFERAYSNATWTQPSTVSFMTSLHHSVLGGLRRGVHSTPVPDAATTMAEHLRRGGYQTASFTANPNAGRVIGLERGLDVLRDSETEHHSISSVELHEWFWRWREDYPGRPYWVHFQTTDVHEPNEPVAPYAHRWVTPEERAELGEWDERLFRAHFAEFGQTGISDWYERALEKAGVDRLAYYERRRGLYDETMSHQDAQLRILVERLQEQGEWENTLLIVAADHGHPAGTFARFGRGLITPQPAPWQGALFDAYATRVPLLVVWPGHVPGGRRHSQPVSMIDVLPTLLDLLDLPPPEALQGQSLAPLVTGGHQEVRPVILDEFRLDEASGEMIGNLEIIDGRWGASLEMGPPVAGGDADHGRRAVPAGGRWGPVHASYPEAPRLLLYDLERDPFATAAVNDAHPDLVEKYRRILLEHWSANQALAARFTEAGQTALDPAQLEQLRALGYIQ